MLDEINERIEGEKMHELSSEVTKEETGSDWSKEIEEISSDDCMTCDIQPVNEYENTEITLYENYMESGGYEDPVCNRKTDDKNKNVKEDGYDIPDNGQKPVTYDVLSSSPEELVLTIDEGALHV